MLVPSWAARLQCSKIDDVGDENRHQNPNVVANSFVSNMRQPHRCSQYSMTRRDHNNLLLSTITYRHFFFSINENTDSSEDTGDEIVYTYYIHHRR